MKYKTFLIIVIFLTFFQLVQSKTKLGKHEFMIKLLNEEEKSHFTTANNLIDVRIDEVETKIKAEGNTNEKDFFLLNYFAKSELFFLYYSKAKNCYNLGNYQKAYVAVNNALKYKMKHRKIASIYMLKFLIENKLDIKNDEHNRLEKKLKSYLNNNKVSYENFFYFLFGRYLLFKNDIKNAMISINKAMLRHDDRKTKVDNTIYKEIALLNIFIKYIQGTSIKKENLEQLSNIDNYWTEIANVNYHYFKAIIYYDKGDMKNAKNEFSKAKNMIKEKNMEYDYNMENLYNIFPKKYREKLNNIENLITNQPKKIHITYN